MGNIGPYFYQQEYLVNSNFYWSDLIYYNSENELSAELKYIIFIITLFRHDRIQTLHTCLEFSLFD